jgi:hypothetical protein
MNRNKKCEKCLAEIYFLKTKNGKFIPVDASSLTTRDKEDLDNGMERLFRYGEHIAHFSSCSQPELFRNKNKEPRLL